MTGSSVTESDTVPHLSIGTTRYLSPEQIKDEKIDCRPKIFLFDAPTIDGVVTFRSAFGLLRILHFVPFLEYCVRTAHRHMASQLPDYYRQFAERRPAEESGKGPSQRRPEPDQTEMAPPVEYRADTFAIDLYEDWQDKTVYILAGPATDDVQHNVTINVGHDVEVDSLIDFADWQVKSLEEELKGCRLLLKDQVQLDCGIPAYRAIFVWYPMEEVRLYQEQLYVLHEGRGYTLTASFTKKTRKTLGPKVERIMRSFTPEPAPVQQQSRSPYY